MGKYRTGIYILIYLQCLCTDQGMCKTCGQLLDSVCELSDSVCEVKVSTCECDYVKWNMVPDTLCILFMVTWLSRSQCFDHFAAFPLGIRYTSLSDKGLQKVCDGGIICKFIAPSGCWCVLTGRRTSLSYSLFLGHKHSWRDLCSTAYQFSNNHYGERKFSDTHSVFAHTLVYPAIHSRSFWSPYIFLLTLVSCCLAQ